MGLFSRAATGNELHAAAEHTGKPAGNAGGITYDPQLVGKLKQEHQELLRIFTAVKTATAQCHFDLLPGMLAEFKHAFLNHVGLENVKIYVYMQQHWETDPETLSFVSGVRKEMNEIARVVMKFVDAHIATPPAPVSLMAFNAELDKVGTALRKRVEMEEARLYELYRP